MQHTQLKAIVSLVSFKKTCQVAGFTYLGMADTMDDDQWSTISLDDVALHFGAENGHIVRPLHALQTGVQGVMVAMGQKDADAGLLQAAAAIA